MGGSGARSNSRGYRSGKKRRANIDFIELLIRSSDRQHKEIAVKPTNPEIRVLAVCGILLLINGCSTLPENLTKDIAGSQVAYSSAGKGKPVVVFETGMGSTMNTWEPVFMEVANFTRVFAYNRPGYGRSKRTRSPQSAGEIAQRLHLVLKQTGHEPPYLLVGHSLGGIFINAFARLYPNEVSGVVFVDSSHPQQFDYLKANRPGLYSILVATSSIGKTRYELDILDGLNSEFEKSDVFPDIPLSVLTAEKSSLFETESMRLKWLEYQGDLASMSTLSKRTEVQGSSHFIHRTHPQKVVDEIRSMVLGEWSN